MLSKAIGIRSTQFVVSLVRHFFCAPSLQITLYVLELLQEKGESEELKNMIYTLASLKTVSGQKTDHEIAKMISKRNLSVPIPSYCLSTSITNCVLCKKVISFWTTKSKKVSQKDKMLGIDFGLTVKAITAEGSFNAKVFKKVCISCDLVYFVNKYVRGAYVNYIDVTSNCEWFGASSETYFLTSYVARTTSAFLQGGIGISVHCEINNWYNCNYQSRI